MFYTILGYVWQYVTNPKAIIALSIFVALIASYNTIPRNLFWALMAVYILGVVGYGIYALIQRYRHEKQGEELAEAISKDTEAEYGKQKDKEELQLIQQRSEEHTSELQSRPHLVCRLLLEKKKQKILT